MGTLEVEPGYELNLAALFPRGWEAEAACRSGQEVDPALFFEPDEFHPEAWKAQTQAAAKAVCARCPVREDCLDHALETGEQFGIWGGLTADERREIRHRPVRLPPSEAPHGTRARYQAGCPCIPCRMDDLHEKRKSNGYYRRTPLYLQVPLEIAAGSKTKR
jgi:WhiB family redox-sensing transcriptional regulator